MTKKSYTRCSYRRRRTNKKNKITRLKSKKKSYKKSYKKGGMLSFRGLVEKASDASPARPLVGEEDDLEGNSIDIDAMKSLFDIVASRDVNDATIRQRPVDPSHAKIFDGTLIPGQIVEIKHDKGDNIRWFGVICRRAVKGGVHVKWFKEINIEGPSFSLELDKDQPKCDLIEFRNIIGIVEF